MIMLHVYVRLAHLGTIKPFQIESPRLNNYKSAGSQISQKQAMIHNTRKTTLDPDSVFNLWTDCVGQRFTQGGKVL